MMEVQVTCSQCGSSIEVVPDVHAYKINCDVCGHVQDIKFTTDHEVGILKECPVCSRMDFYKQKDFNRKIGVILFVVAAILSIWTYGLSLVVLYLFDLFLFRKLSMVVICYKCRTNFRKVMNIADIRDFDHEMNDRIVYSDHDFKGKPLSH
jgi:predicted nucleic acid-binding Zn ribbon protein